MNDRTVFHIDANSAYLSWSAADRVLNHNDSIDLREICSVVGGNQDTRHGIVLAKSIPAKKYKIQTGEPVIFAKQKCPELVVIPPDYKLYVETSRAFIELLSKYCPRIEQYSIDEVWADVSGTNVLFGSPVLFAEFLRQEIYKQLGFTVNIGVSTNKLLAKMASELRKPNQVHTLYPSEIPKKMWPLDVNELFFIGKATEKKLRGIGIRTIGDIAHTDVRSLKAHLKKHGEIIHAFSWGDSSYLDGLITVQQGENKGYGNSMTLPFDFEESQQSELALLSLCETVGERLRSDAVRIKCVSVSLTYCDFERVSHQMQMYSETNVTEELFENVKRIFREIWDGRPIRQLGVHTSKVSKEKIRQYNLFDLDRYERQEKLDTVIDKIRGRYGKDAIMRACFLNQRTIKHMSGGISEERITGITKPVVDKKHD